MGSLGGREGPRVGAFGAPPQSQSCLGNSEGWPQVAQDGHVGLVLPLCQTLAKFLPAPSQLLIHVLGLVPPPSPPPQILPWHNRPGSPA